MVLTDDHHDHSEAVRPLLERYPAPLAGGRGAVDIMLSEDARFGPFEAVATPGHAADHFALVADGACFTGDAVLGEGSVFISPHRGAMAGYLLALARLRLREDIDVLCPGHGPPVWDAQAKLEEYVGHRVDRENHLIVALGEGRRRSRSCSTPSGSTCPGRCGLSRPPRWPPTSTSSRKSRSCPRASSGRSSSEPNGEHARPRPPVGGDG